MHSSTFEYLKPTDAQINRMAGVRVAAKTFSDVLEMQLPEGPDKTYILRKLREISMWCNVSITRHPDGAPRE
jgi:hypothetical protein